MEKKQTKNIDISVQEPEEIFHPDYVASQQKKKKRFRGMLGHWFGLFLVIIISIVIFYCLSNMVHILKAVRTLVKLLMPVIYGLVIAYLLNPLMVFYGNVFYRLFGRKIPEDEERHVERYQKFSKVISLILAMITGLLIITVLLWMLIPQVFNSVIALANTLPDQAQDYYHKVSKWVMDNPYMANQFQDALLHLTDSLDEWTQKDLLPWLQTGLLPNVNSLASMFASGVFSVLGVLYNLLIGCIVAVYLLLGKEKFLAQAKKMIYAVFGKKQADVILHYSRMTNDTFSGFIVGKIVDSAIIGVICFIVMWILKLPYSLLISVIVGVTNVIPVFGPYIGAVPSALLILLVSPMQCLYFVVFIIILQQLDGNVIGPAILGESTGLTAFWVLFAILLFGGMWGIVGMIVGVPLFAMIYRLLKDYLELRLYHKRLSTETEMYKDLKSIQSDVQGDKHYILYTKKEKRNANLRRDAEDKITLMQLLDQKPMDVSDAEGEQPKLKNAAGQDSQNASEKTVDDLTEGGRDEYGKVVEAGENMPGRTVEAADVLVTDKQEHK